MNRFQDLLKVSATASPIDEQRRSSEQLAARVAMSQLCWWPTSGTLASSDEFLVLVVAPWSHYDLALLDLLDELKSQPTSAPPSVNPPIYVANLEHYQSLDQLAADFPVVTCPPLQTPLALLWRDGGWSQCATGKTGRDLVARTLEISAATLNEAVIARVPSSQPRQS